MDAKKSVKEKMFVHTLVVGREKFIPWRLYGDYIMIILQYIESHGLSRTTALIMFSVWLFYGTIYVGKYIIDVYVCGVTVRLHSSVGVLH